MSLPLTELALRCHKIQEALRAEGCDGILLRSIPSQLYLTGSVSSGWIFLPVEGEALFFPDRLSDRLTGYPPERINPVRKPELIPKLLASYGYRISSRTVLEKGYLSVSDYERLVKLSADDSVSEVDGAVLMRRVRMVKTPMEIDLIRECCRIHSEIYKEAPSLYRPGMTDLEWQYELEYLMRRKGWVGLFRTFGTQMEGSSGTVLAGDNAVSASPYDFTMGGHGTSPFPIGATGHPIRRGETVMVDLAGDFSQYQSDCTRTYYLGTLPDEALRLHELSIEMHHLLEQEAGAGFPISEIYNRSLRMAEEAGAAEYFMGGDFHAKYVGHGVGLEINELPVLSGRYAGELEEGMVIAYEPKFVLTGIGAVGIEDTYLVGADGMERLTTPERALVRLGE